MKERAQSPEVLARPVFKFVYVEHDGIENARVAWEELKDCDIILQEEIGMTESQRLIQEKRIAEATHKPFSPSGFQIKRKILSRKDLNWGSYLLANAVETKKEFHYIDIRGDSPAQEINRDAQAFYKEAFHLLNHGSPTEALMYLRKSVEKYAQSNGIRTGTIMVQIGALLASEGGRLNGKKIGVIQGAAHQAGFESFKNKFPNYPSEKVTPIKRYAHIYSGLLATAELSKGANIPDQELIKTFLADDILFSYLRVLRQGAPETHLYSLADQIVDTLTPLEIEEYWKVVLSTEKTSPNNVFLSIAYLMAKKYGLEEPSLK